MHTEDFLPHSKVDDSTKTFNVWKKLSFLKTHTHIEILTVTKK